MGEGVVRRADAEPDDAGLVELHERGVHAPRRAPTPSSWRPSRAPRTRGRTRDGSPGSQVVDRVHAGDEVGRAERLGEPERRRENTTLRAGTYDRDRAGHRGFVAALRHGDVRGERRAADRRQVDAHRAVVRQSRAPSRRVRRPRRSLDAVALAVVHGERRARNPARAPREHVAGRARPRAARRRASSRRSRPPARPQPDVQPGRQAQSFALAEFGERHGAVAQQPASVSPSGMSMMRFREGRGCARGAACRSCRDRRRRRS